MARQSMTAADEIQAAAASGEVGRVMMLAARVSEYARRDALRSAAERDRLDVVRSLAELGVPLDYMLSAAVGQNAREVMTWLLAQRPADLTADGFFADACASAQPDVIGELLERGAPIDDRSGGWSGLMNAAREKRPDVISLLLERGADRRGFLLGAVSGGDPAIVAQARERESEVGFTDDRGLTALMAAADAGDADTVRWLIGKQKAKQAKKGPLDVGDGEGRTAIAYAARSKHLAIVELLAEHGAALEPALPHAEYYSKDPQTFQIVQWLLDHGADANAKESSSSDTALLHAAEAGWDDMVDLLLARGAKVNVENIINSTPLTRAARHGHAGVVRRLLDAGARIAKKSSESWGDTPLEEAIEGGHVAIVELLVARGALRTPSRRPPLHKAASEGHAAIVGLLLDRGVDINEAEDSYDKTTALRAAAERGHLDVVTLLLDRGAVDEPDEYSAIRRAASRGHVDVVALLAQRGLGEPRGIGVVPGAAERDDVDNLRRAIELDPDVNTPGHYEYLALHRAAACGRLDNVRLLLEHGADPNLRDKEGKTAHRVALDGDHYDIAELLEQRGARLDVLELIAIAKQGDEAAVQALFARPINVDVKGELDRTALHEAAEHGHVAIARLLVERGATLDVQDEDGWTPLMEAAEMGHLAIVQFLVERGAAPFLEERTRLTAYQLAKQAGHTDVVAYLESRAADEDPHVALEKAIESDDAERVGVLAPRCGITAALPNGNLPLHFAARRGAASVVAKLLALGCPVDLLDSGEQTALYLAAEQGHLEVVKALLAAGASPTIEHCRGTLVLGRAVWYGHAETVEAMLDAGFSPSTPQGETSPTEMALRAGHTAIARLLIDRGADITGKAGAAILAEAVSREVPDLVEQLLAKHAPIDITSYSLREAALGWLAQGRALTFLDPQEVLRRAASDGNLQLLEAALAAGADPNAAGDDDDTALVQALKYDHWEVAERLLAVGADPNRGEYYGTTIAVQLAKDGKVERVERLVKAGAKLTGCLVALAAKDEPPSDAIVKLCLAHGDDVDRVDDRGKTALAHAAAKGHDAFARLLLEHRARADTADETGTTALAEAAGAGSLELVRALVERGADLHAKNKRGTTAIMRAARAGAEAVVAWCSEQGASPAGCLAESGGSGKLALVKQFLELCDLEETDAGDWTAAMNAAASKHKKLFELLLERGAKVDRCAIAAAWGSGKENLALALARGASVDGRDFAGRTPLVIASSQGNAEAVQLLLSKHASIDLQDDDGETALIAAVRGGEHRVAKLLLKAGANRGLCTKDGKSAEDYATYDHQMQKILEV